MLPDAPAYDECLQTTSDSDSTFAANERCEFTPFYYTAFTPHSRTEQQLGCGKPHTELLSNLLHGGYLPRRFTGGKNKTTALGKFLAQWPSCCSFQ